MIILQDSQIKKIFHNGDEVKKILDWAGNVIFYKQSGGMTNTIKFQVGDLNGNTDKTVTVNYYEGGSETIPITDGNKWYVHRIPSGKSLKQFVVIDNITDTIISARIKYDDFGISAIIQNIQGNVSFLACDISELTDMSHMFWGCSSLQSLDVSNFDTSKITHMYGMFRECSSLQTLDVSNFDTSKVITMMYMFYACSSLQSLDVSNFDTSKVIEMKSMFDNCSSLQTLDVSNFDTSNVTTMDSMFSNCHSLQSLDLSNFNTSNVTSMYSMFYSCSLQTLNLNGWDMTKVTDTDSMFSGCYRLKTIYMIGCNQTTIDKIKSALTSAGILNNVTIVTE